MTENKLSPEMEQIIAAWFRKLGENICPHCDTTIAQQEQVGHCVYARPCGHRLYQGKINAFTSVTAGRAGTGPQ
jgi:hypothetical protein